jgi:hypothetical protein
VNGAKPDAGIGSPIDRALLCSRVNSSPGGPGADAHDAEAHELEERIAEADWGESVVQQQPPPGHEVPRLQSDAP